MSRYSKYKERPVIYSCSGASSAAQLANAVAVQADREMLAEMSYIAGVGGDVPSLVKVAQSGRQIIAVDGCPLNCAKKSLARHGVEPTIHMTLTKEGVKKRYHHDYEPEDV